MAINMTQMCLVLKIIYVSGKCICSTSFYDIDCGLDIRVPPTISGIPDVGLCDLTERECAQTSVLGFGFVETPALSCGIIPFQVRI